MENEGKKFFEHINDKMVEMIAASAQSAITYVLRAENEADLGFLKFTLTQQGTGEAGAVIPSVEISDDFKDMVSDDDMVFDESFSKKVKTIIQKAASSDFMDAFQNLLEGAVYNSDKNKIEEASGDSASTHDMNPDIMSAMLAMLIGSIITDLNENKGTEPYKIDVLNILDVKVEVAGSGKVKIAAAPHRALKQLVKNDTK